MHNNGTMPDIPVETIAETANYMIWSADEPDGEKTYHVDLGPVTAHFFNEEWAEFLTLIRQAVESGINVEDDGDDATEVELDWGTLYFAPDEWAEFLQLIEQA